MTSLGRSRSLLLLPFLLAAACSLREASPEAMAPTELEASIGKTVAAIQTEVAKAQPDLASVAEQAKEVSGEATILAGEFAKQDKKHGMIRVNAAKAVARDAGALQAAAERKDRPSVDAAASALQSSWSRLAQIARPD